MCVLVPRRCNALLLLLPPVWPPASPPPQDGSLGHQLPPEQRNAQCKRQEASLGALSSKGVFDALPLGCNYAVGHFDFR